MKNGYPQHPTCNVVPETSLSHTNVKQKRKIIQESNAHSSYQLVPNLQQIHTLATLMTIRTDLREAIIKC